MNYIIRFLAVYGLLVIICMPTSAFAQWGKGNWDVSGGVSLQLGTLIRRVGVFVRTHYIQHQVQGSLEGRLHYNFSAYGPPQSGWEGQTRIGLLFAFTPIVKRELYLKDIGVNLTDYKYAVSYAFNAYFDQIKTSQTTGTIGLHLGKLLLLAENDILGKPGSDQFRTGSFLLAWQDSTIRLGIHTAMWTGNPHTNRTKYVDESEFARFGYKDISEGPYGKFSNGVLAFSAEYAVYPGQIVRFQMGADAEQIRNTLQNRLMHDMYFIPKKWNRAQNRHLPMLDIDGDPFLYEPDQQIRKAKFFSELSVNPTLFY